MRCLVLAAFLLAFPAASATAQGSYGAPPMNEFFAGPSFPKTTMTYGDGGRLLTIAAPRRSSPAPVVIWVAGADYVRDAENISTEWLPALFYENGYALAEISAARANMYDARGVLRDNLTAISRIVADAERLGIDPDRIILLGRGAGAHMAALLGTDSSLLDEAGIGFFRLRGVIAINGDGYDLPTAIATASAYRARQYRRVFGDDPADWRSLSAMAHLGRPDAPFFLFQAARDRSGFLTQAEHIAEALRAGGSRAELWPMERTRLRVPGTYIGAPQHPRTADMLSAIREMAPIRSAAR